MTAKLSSANRLRLNSTSRFRSTGGSSSPPPLTAATAITLIDVVDRWIYQRVGTSKLITYAGTYTGPCVQIQIRVVPYGTAIDSSSYPWTTYTSNISGGFWNLEHDTPQSAEWMIVQVRDAVDTAISAGGANRFGVGARILPFGQSNMVGLATGTAEYPNSSDLTRRFAGASTNMWRRVGNYASGYPPNTPSSVYAGGGFDSSAAITTGESSGSSGRGDGVSYLANYLQEELGVLVAILEFSKGGTSITTWIPGGSSWNNMINGLSLIGDDFEAAVYLQGENDAAAGMSTATYKGHLTTLYAGLLTQTGRSASDFVFGIVGLGPGVTYMGVEGNAARIRQAQLEFVAANANVYYSSTAHDADLNGGDIHFIGSSQGRMGKRYARGILAKLGLVTHGVAGPYITGATRAGAVITVNVAHVGGTSLADGAGGSGTALLGWRVYDNAVAATLISTSIVGNTIILTLSAIPAGPVTLDHAMANLPFGSTRNLASVVYDNDTVTGDTLGLPLRPCALITVS